MGTRLQNLKKKLNLSKSVSGKKAVPDNLPAFTFFYAVTFYLLLLSFYFWQTNTDIEPKKTRK